MAFDVAPDLLDISGKINVSPTLPNIWNAHIVDAEVPMMGNRFDWDMGYSSNNGLVDQYKPSSNLLDDKTHSLTNCPESMPVHGSNSVLDWDAESTNEHECEPKGDYLNDSLSVSSSMMIIFESESSDLIREFDSSKLTKVPEIPGFTDRLKSDLMKTMVDKDSETLVQYFM